MFHGVVTIIVVSILTIIIEDKNINILIYCIIIIT